MDIAVTDTKTINEALATQESGYKRSIMQTYMTAPEWRNVDMAGELAKFAASNRPFYQFPYFSQIIDFWKIVANSFKAARQNGSSWKELLLSDYFVMDVFVGTFTTVEYGFKGLFSLPAKAFSWLVGHRENKTDVQQKLSEVFRDYADFIHHTPFYDYKYTHWVKELWSTFFNSSNKSLDDFLSLLYYSCELPMRGLIAAPVSWFYNSEGNQTVQTIDVLLSHEKQDDTAITDAANQALHQTANKHSDVPQGELIDLSKIDETQQTTSAADESYSFIAARLPKYEPLMTAIADLKQHGFKVERIAGQDHVQLKCKVENTEQVEEMLADLQKWLGVSVLYHYQNHIEPNVHFVMLNVLTEQLNQVMEQINQKQDINLSLIHDF